MPLHVLPNRRQFLASTIAAGAALSWSRFALGSDLKPARTFALLADTHVGADRAAVHGGVNMAANLERVWEEVREANPSAMLVHGDVARLTGEVGDYKTISELLMPAGKAELPLHFLLGNHDARGPFRDVLNDHAGSLLDSRHVAILATGPANWFMLDSLNGPTFGVLGDEQLKWLAAVLDAHADKPAIISLHHHPVWPTGAPDFKVTGIADTVQLFEILEPRKQVKAVFFGHTHNWGITQREGIHLVNLPPVAYLFNKTRPNGWVRADLTANGVTLTLSALDKSHPEHGETHELAWR